MGHRLTKIYTRTGDKGTTGIGDGSRVDKDDPRVEAYGTVDELNSVIGMVLSYQLPEDINAILNAVQHELFDLGGELCIPDTVVITESHITRLEQALERFNAPLPPLKEFILPAGAHATATCHLARAVCRRAERRLVTLAREQAANPHGMTYLNRLSDLLFVIARVIARNEGAGEVTWSHQR